jgi:protein tyrosine phosphatase (PTP) superfamily phosphohydrolase (DUF442 family)
MNTMNRLLLASVLLLTGGCCNNQPRPWTQSQPVPPPSPRPVLPVNPAPQAAFPVAPPPGAPYPAQPPGAAFPTAPPAAPYPVAVPAQPPGGAFPTVPPTAPSAPLQPQSSYPTAPPSDPIAQVENRWQPINPGVQLGAPEPVASAAAKPPTALYPPDKTAEPPLGSATALPVGIAQFALAKDNVATGLRPLLDEGLDWLKAHGYRSVVQIQLPGDKDSPDRKQVEKRGMIYLSLDVSPQTLSKDTVLEFNRIVRDTSGQPVFIYDRDGALAGALWYLYFRTVDQFPDDVARVRARSLGLREDRDGTHRDMWLAVQKYLGGVKGEE